MYVPYAAVYYVDRVHLMCSINAACHYLAMSDYFTMEIVLLAFGALLQCPIWLFMLLLLDVNKSGGNVSDLFKHYFLVSANLRYYLKFLLLIVNLFFSLYINMYFKVIRLYYFIDSYSYPVLQFNCDLFDCML